MTVKVRDCDIDLETLVLQGGSHSKDSGEYCLLEAVACVAGEVHSDHPKSVSPAIAAFGRAWNDALDDESRQILKPYVTRVIGTNTGTADEKRRAWLATDWLVRVFAPAWLDLAGLSEHSNKLRQLPELSSNELAIEAQPIISAADEAAESAAWSAAGLAAWSAAGLAARLAAWSAAGSAAWSAAWSAADQAARLAAWSAADQAADQAARSAARLAARLAARSAARLAARLAAESAAESAADKALAPTVAVLQTSALDLLDRMIAVGKVKVAL